MRTLLNAVPLLGCASMMVICARMMGGRRPTPDDNQTESSTDVAAEVAELRAEVARLRDAQARSDAEDSHG